MYAYDHVLYKAAPNPYCDFLNNTNNRKNNFEPNFNTENYGCQTLLLLLHSHNYSDKLDSTIWIFAYHVLKICLGKLLGLYVLPLKVAYIFNVLVAY